jgi:TatD DNase family protein
MDLPETGDYIDIHTHGSLPATGVFKVENLMAHEGKQPADLKGMAFTAGIHPWHLDEANSSRLVQFVRITASEPSVLAVGEAGFDRLRGPSMELQRRIFGEQVNIANEYKKPVVIHCVRAWDELLAAHKKLKPETPWLVHGFRGKKELASQLLVRGMFISVWFEFALRTESAELIRYLPEDRFFLETDGADVDIREIFDKVASDLNHSDNELRSIIHNNFFRFFGVKFL